MRALLNMIESLGHYVLFSFDSLRWAFIRPFRFRRIIEEIQFIGTESLFIIGLTSSFTGAVFAFTGWLAFKTVGAEELVGPSVALSLALEIGPVLTALIITGRAGAAMAAEIGTMKVYEQLDALQVMAIEPKQYLVAPKIIGAIISLPLLTTVFNLIGNLGGYLVAVYVCEIDPGIYVYKLKQFLLPADFFHGFYKAICFGFVLGTVGCYKGFNTKNGAMGVGKSTNDAVVYASVTVLILDYFLSRIIPLGAR